MDLHEPIIKGITTSDSSYTGTAFIKTSGTSAQFLIADGSVKIFGTTIGTVAQGNDSRFTDARVASDVYAWAKASVKPTYTYTEVGAAASAHTHSYEPVIAVGTTAQYWRGDKSWQTLPTYTHPTGDGNLHVTATGTTSNGKVLTAGATAGSFSWQTPTSGVTDHTLLSNIGTNTHAAIDIHIGQTTMHFVMAEISITASQVSNFATSVVASTVVNLTTTHAATTVTINSDKGTDAIINGATTSLAGVVTNGDQTFAGIKTIQQNSTSTTAPNLIIDQLGTGDAMMQFKVAATTWSIGIDNSVAGDDFKIAATTSLGTAYDVLTIGKTGKMDVFTTLWVTGDIYTLNSGNVYANNTVTNETDTYTATAKVTKIITCSLAEYNAIGTKDANTLYVII